MIWWVLLALGVVVILCGFGYLLIIKGERDRLREDAAANVVHLEKAYEAIIKLKEALLRTGEPDPTLDDLDLMFDDEGSDIRPG